MLPGNERLTTTRPSLLPQSQNAPSSSHSLLTLASPSPGCNTEAAICTRPTPILPPRPVCSPQQGTRSGVLGWGAMEGMRGLQGAAGGPAGAVPQVPTGTQGAAGQSAPGGGRGQRLPRVS